MVRCRTILQAAAAVGVCIIDFSSAFSFTPRISKQGTRSSQLPMQWNDDDSEANINTIKSRREFFTKIATIAPILLTATQASAVTNEPTRIELVVDTEYLIRVLNYFDGDMRKVLGALVRSPQTTVEIEPPPKGNDPNLTPENAILRALYSYSSPEDYATQASWLKVDDPDKGWVRALTKKRWRIYLPSIGSDGNEENGKLEVNIRPTNLNLSNLEAGVVLGVLSYPLAYSYYNYESYQEEQASIAKKAQMAAKRAAKANAAAAKKSKGTPKKENVEVKTDEGKKQKPAMKGQETKKGGLDKKPLPTKKVTTVAKDIESTRPAEGSIEDLNAAEMLDSQRKTFIAANEQQKTSQLETQPGQYDNELEQLVAAAAAAAAATANPSESLKPTDGSYLDNLSQESQSNTPAGATVYLDEPAGATGYLDDQSLNFSESAQSGSSPNTGANLRSLAENMKPQRGSSNSYLDSL